MAAPLSRSRGIDKLPRVMYNANIGEACLKEGRNTARRKRAQAGLQNAPKVHNYTIAPATVALYQNRRLFSPLGTNFNTKLVPIFLHIWLCGYAAIKSAKVRKGQNLQFMKVVASFQEIERFTVAIRGGFLMAHDRRL